MRIKFMMAGVALAALTPSVASAATCQEHRTGRVAATVGGGAVGALLGTAIAGKGDNTEGAIIGGVVGAIAGNQIAKASDNDCKYAYGWYDKNGRWHANRVRTGDARGYYDRNGDWVAGRPTGYYEGDRWIAYSGDVNSYGYYDNSGYYVPTSASGYYDSDGRWVSGYASGYYDSRGRWVAGPARGRYDSRGRWIAGDPGYGENQSWSSIEQPGYWDNGRWIAGTTYGYYDSRGRWVRSDRYGNATGNDRWDDNNGWNDMPGSLDQRITWLRDRVQRMEDRGRLSRAEESYALGELNRIEYQHRTFMRDGRLNAREEATIRNRIDRLSDRVRAARQSNRSY